MRAPRRASNRYVLAVDQGTTSSRAIVYDAAGQLVSVLQREHRQLYPAAGQVEHDANEVRRQVQALIGRAITAAGIGAGQVVGIGIANQRETTVLWDRRTGRPVGNAIVWQDTRTDDLVAHLSARPGVDEVSELSGLPLLGYFAAPRIRWLLDRDERLRAGAERGDVLFGTMDSWLIWNLTGGVHVTDVSNAGRTMLMNLHTLDWDRRLLEFFDIPRAMLPEIRSSAEVYGRTVIEPSGIPIAAALGDQQAALVGQTCFAAGETKCTYGTGAFLLSNTGTAPVRSQHGLLTTVGFRLGDEPAHYALEGSIASTGSLVQWLRDRLGLIDFAPEVETLAATVADNGGCSVVPAFSGLFAPRWQAEARGVIAGLTSYITRGHVARAVLEATAWQTREVVEALNADTGRPLTELRVDGGMTSNNLLMQQISDALGVPVQRPLFAETVSLGAAYAAGLAVGLWPDVDGLRRNRHIAGRWEPAVSAAGRDRGYRQWSRAAALSYDWTGHQ
ncbi:glycerol kinase GlpK [Nocardia cyriacigeorgica]|uniref:glycerol kinase GlpK n=2 Tax=Nocardia cyriacigeorgica TaxID=135487 RepID=UPI0018954310|nr:glycerol kinase GlpK [Nocardia cyriacigeorgica]MBF6435104.1 glycerol kinase GlpK [Nocardia cyriacigeorgica]